MYNRHIYRTGVDCNKLFHCSDDLVVKVRLDILPRDYQERFILKDVNKYINGFLKSIQRSMFMEIVSDEEEIQTFKFIFQLNGQDFTRHVTYYFMTKVQ